MKCFEHQLLDAVAVCKSCGRGLCTDCVAQVDTACACRNRCEQDVATLNALVARTQRSYRNAPITGAMLILIGIAMILVGRDRHDIWSQLLGGAFIAYAFAVLWAARRSKQH